MKKQKLFLLENGLRVFIYSFPELETVGISLGIKYGSVDENPEINGSAHFLEHMMFKGTKKRTWKNINEQIKDIGAYDNAYTDREITNYIFQVHKKYLKNGISLLSDMTLNSTIPKKEFELERGPIINENLIREDNPENLFYDYMPKVLFKGHPAEMPVGGNNELTIKKITRDHLFEIYKKYYCPKNMFLSIAGGVEIDNAIKLAKDYFEIYKSEFNTPKRTLFKGKNELRKVVVKKIGIKQARIGIGFSLKPFNKERINEYAGMSILNAIIKYRLYEEIREKRGLSYDPYSVYQAGNTIVMISAEAGIEEKNVNEVEKIIVKEFEKIQNGELDKNELERMKKAIIIKLSIYKERSLDMSTNITSLGVVEEMPDLFQKLPAIIQKINIDNIRKIGQENINCNKYSEILLMPKK
ncbi:MAG: pitrilysin family protein [Candidatus Micrarchaeaceae archaeon]